MRKDILCRMLDPVLTDKWPSLCVVTASAQLYELRVQCTEELSLF